MVAPSKLFSFANSSITPCLCTRPQGPFSANAKRLEIQQKKSKEPTRKKRMKQGPAENMTIAVLKQLLKDKGIAFSSKAKKSELVQIFNTQAGYVTAYQ